MRIPVEVDSSVFVDGLRADEVGFMLEQRYGDARPRCDVRGIDAADDDGREVEDLVRPFARSGADGSALRAFDGRIRGVRVDVDEVGCEEVRGGVDGDEVLELELDIGVGAVGHDVHEMHAVGDGVDGRGRRAVKTREGARGGICGGEEVEDDSDEDGGGPELHQHRFGPHQHRVAVAHRVAVER